MWQVVYDCKEVGEHRVIAEAETYAQASKIGSAAMSSMGLFQQDCFKIPDKPARLPSSGITVTKV